MNGTDPSGYATLAEVMVANHVQQLIIKYYYFPIALRVFSDFIPRLVEAVIPQTAKNIIKDASLISCDVIGGGGSVALAGKLKGFTIGATASLSAEVLQSVHTPGYAVYVTPAVGLVLGGSAGPGASLGAYGGTVWNAPDSQAYAGHTINVTVTIPMKADWTENLAEKIEKDRSFAPPSYAEGKALEALLGANYDNLKNFSPRKDTVFTVGIGFAGTVAVTKPSIGVSWPPGGKSPPSVSITYSYGYQVYPKNDAAVSFTHFPTTPAAPGP